MNKPDALANFAVDIRRVCRINRLLRENLSLRVAAQNIFRRRRIDDHYVNPVARIRADYRIIVCFDLAAFRRIYFAAAFGKKALI